MSAVPPAPRVRPGRAAGLRVLHAVPSLDPRAGGPTASVSQLCLSQSAAGLRPSVVTFAAPDADRRAIRRLESAGVPVAALPAGNRLSAARRLRDAGPDLIRDADGLHLHGLWEELQPRLAAAAGRAGVPCVVSPRGMLAPWSLARGRVKKRVYFELRARRMLDAAAAIHITTAEEGRLFARLNLAAPTVTVPNGIDRREFAAPDPAAFRAGVPELRRHAGPLAVFLGRLHPVKGLEELIPGFARCGVPGAKLALVGPGEASYERKLRRLAAACGAGDRVSFCGMRHGAGRVDALAAADLFVLPSYQENFGVAAAEALACGVPVLLGRGVNLAGEIAGAGVGAVCETDAAALAGELRRWLGDRPACRRAGVRARAFSARYRNAAVAARWAGVWGGLTGREPVPGVARARRAA